MLDKNTMKQIRLLIAASDAVAIGLVLVWWLATRA